MTKKDIAEIKRRFRPGHNNMGTVLGYYMGNDGKLLSRFTQDFINMGEVEAGKVLGAIRKIYGGTPEKNGVNVPVGTVPAAGDAVSAQKMLIDLRDTKLRNPEIIEHLISKIASSYRCDDNYIILLVSDAMDITAKNSAGEDDFESGYQFRYFSVAVCPLKQKDNPLSFFMADSQFRDFDSGLTVLSPDFGFMFPAFEGRCADVNNVYFYTSDISADRSELTKEIFGSEGYTSSGKKKEDFHGIVRESIGADMDYKMYRSINDTLHDLMKEYDESEDADDGALMLGASELAAVLDQCGASSEQKEIFRERFSHEMGANGEIAAAAIADKGAYKITTGDITVSVKQDKAYLVRTERIDGCPCIIIKAPEGIEVNGVKVN